MSNMSKAQRDFYLPQILERNGHDLCVRCGKKGEVIHHVNGNNSDNRLENLDNLCFSCNKLKALQKKHLQKKPHYIRTPTPEMIKNRKGEPKFRNWLYNYVLRNHFITWEDAINAGAEYSEMSREAIKNYLLKLTSFQGIYGKDLQNQDGEVIVYFREEESQVLEEIEKQAGVKFVK